MAKRTEEPENAAEDALETSIGIEVNDIFQLQKGALLYFSRQYSGLKAYHMKL